MADPASLPPLDYQNPARLMHRPVRLSSRWKTAACCAGLAASVLLFTTCLPVGRARESANRVKCFSNLIQIWRAISIYASEYQGELPLDWPTLLATEDLVPEVFTCPSHDQERAEGATTQAVFASMLSGDHLGYVWVGRGLKQADLTPDTVLAFDLEHHVPRDNARTTGMNVLFGDGTVEFVDVPTGKAIWAQTIAGVRPVVRPNASATAATQPLPH